MLNSLYFSIVLISFHLRSAPNTPMPMHVRIFLQEYAPLLPVEYKPAHSIGDKICQSQSSMAGKNKAQKQTKKSGTYPTKTALVHCPV